VPLCPKNLFTECRELLLKFTGNQGFTNSQSVCDNGLKVIRGSSFTLNTHKLVSNEIVGNNIYDTEELLIEGLCDLCQTIANIIQRTVYYQVNTNEYNAQAFKITPEEN
jgi:hypothetical protein